MSNIIVELNDSNILNKSSELRLSEMILKMNIKNLSIKK